MLNPLIAHHGFGILGIGVGRGVAKRWFDALAPGRGLAALRVALALAFPVPDVRPANGFGFVLGLTPPF